MTPTVVEGQARPAREERERAENKSATAGTRTGREAGCEGELARDSEARGSSETHQVEPGGMHGKNQTPTLRDLPRESWAEVSRGHSSEEGWRKPDGAKGRRTARDRAKGQPGDEAQRKSEATGRDNCGHPPDDGPTRSGGTAAREDWGRTGRRGCGSRKESDV